MFVGASSLACSWRMGITLLAFFGASSRLTQFREELKDVDESHRSGGQRDWQQVCLWLLLVHVANGFDFMSGHAVRVKKKHVDSRMLHSSGVGNAVDTGVTSHQL